MLKHQQVTAILKKAGYKPMRSRWITEGNRRYKQMIKGYSVMQGRGFVGVECCMIMDEFDNIIKALENAGLKAEETFKGGGYLKVTPA